MPWIPVLMCCACPEVVPFERGDHDRDVENRAKNLKWTEERGRWYCPTCFRAVRTPLGPAALVACLPKPPSG